jgi:two-component system, OmpR family, alkaline phosphatase synthesis response regulator PhoP
MPTVLVVEDERDIRDAMAEALSAEGYVVVVAADGQDAIHRLRDKTSADVIVLDMMMPVMDGWQFLSAKAADPALARIPVIVTSAAPQKLPRGADVLLGKPFDLGRLLAEIASLTRG